MKIKDIEISDLPALQRFADLYIRKNYIANRDFFKWQYFNSPFNDKKNNDCGVLACFHEDKAVSLSLRVKTAFLVQGSLRTGLWHHEWFADTKAPGSGMWLLKEQTKRNPVLAGAGMSLLSSNFYRMLRPICWFNLKRIFFCLDARKTYGLLLIKDIDSALPYLQSHNLSQKTPGKIEPVSEFEDEYETIWNRVGKTFSLATHRNSDYMNWRYLQHPVFRYQAYRCNIGKALAYYVLRQEPVPNTDFFVVRLCEAIGTPEDISVTVPCLLNLLKDKPVAFVDFFCSNSNIIAALMQGGMQEVITLRDFDLPRYFSPLADDVRKTINFFYQLDKPLITPSFYNFHEAYITKGDSNQDRPN
jgi:hypothetical protein